MVQATSLEFGLQILGQGNDNDRLAPPEANVAVQTGCLDSSESSDHLVTSGVGSFDQPGADFFDQVVSAWIGSQLLFGRSQDPVEANQNHALYDPGANLFEAAPQVLSLEPSNACRDVSFWLTLLLNLRHILFATLQFLEPHQ